MVRLIEKKNSIGWFTFVDLFGLKLPFLIEFPLEYPLAGRYQHISSILSAEYTYEII